MNVGPIQAFMIENESDADDYLADLLKEPNYRSMDEVTLRAQKYIRDAQIKNYFLNKAKELLKAYSS